MWPHKSDIICTNFTKDLYPLLRRAIINGAVCWIDDSTKSTGDRTIANFTWNECTWQIEERGDMVHKFTLLNGTLSPDLTAMVLQG